MVRSQRKARSTRQEGGSKKVGILLPYRDYAVYEEIAHNEHITIAQVIARVAIEFAEVESEASRSRRAIIGSHKEGRRPKEWSLAKIRAR